MKEIPKIMAVQDMSGVGRCSLTVIIPIMSALGCQVCPLPTALLSNQFRIQGILFLISLTIWKNIIHTEKNNFWFDCGLQRFYRL